MVFEGKKEGMSSYVLKKIIWKKHLEQNLAILHGSKKKLPWQIFSGLWVG